MCERSGRRRRRGQTMISRLNGIRNTNQDHAQSYTNPKSRGGLIRELATIKLLIRRGYRQEGTAEDLEDGAKDEEVNRRNLQAAGEERGEDDAHGDHEAVRQKLHA
jgi:hypothetical protein